MTEIPPPAGGVTLRISGPLVEVAPDIWVNALHVAAVVPIEEVKSGQPQQRCRVYVAGPSLGGGHVLAWNSAVSAEQMVGLLNLALQNADRERGHWEERGRISALDHAGDTGDDDIEDDDEDEDDDDDE